jgi:hypothetical protein
MEDPPKPLATVDWKSLMETLVIISSQALYTKGRFRDYPFVLSKAFGEGEKE